MKRIALIVTLVLASAGIGALAERASTEPQLALAKMIATKCDTGWSIPADVCEVTPGKDANALPTPEPIDMQYACKHALRGDPECKRVR